MEPNKWQVSKLLFFRLENQRSTSHYLIYKDLTNMCMIATWFKETNKTIMVRELFETICVLKTDSLIM